MTKGTCSVEGCSTNVEARGWCKKHYKRWLRNGNTAPRPEQPAICTIEGCPKPTKARTWCAAHYARWSKLGDPLAGPPMRRSGGQAGCSFPGCDREYKAGGYCAGHYAQHRSSRALAPLIEGPTRRETSHMSTRERFMHFVVEGNGDECWVWTGALVGGYGQFSTGGVVHYAHRYAYETSVRELPEDIQVDHICRNRACVNLNHLREATNKQNQENRAPGRNSATGFRNVYEGKNGALIVRATSNGVHHYAGSYSNLGDAVEAAKGLRDRLFTHHGKDSHV